MFTEKKIWIHLFFSHGGWRNVSVAHPLPVKRVEIISWNNAIRIPKIVLKIHLISHYIYGKLFFNLIGGEGAWEMISTCFTYWMF